MKLTEKYPKEGEFTQKKWEDNAWKDWNLTKETFHTKARWPKFELHLWVHHTNNKNDTKKCFNRGFTIVKDNRFKNAKGNYWQLRLELIPKRDKKRNTRGLAVAKNEFGKKRMVLDILWKNEEDEDDL